MVAQTPLRTERGDDSKDDPLTEIARAAIGGSDEAFAELHHLLAERVLNLVFRSVHDRTVAEDLCQDVWLKVHGQIRGLRSPESVRSWVYQIASRICVDHARSLKGRTMTDIDTVEHLFEAGQDQPEASALRASEMRTVWQALAAMAPRQSIALYLKQVDGCSYQEIAGILGCPISTVETLLFRARQAFSRSYERADSSRAERCGMTRKIMARLVDQEPSAFQETALKAHVEECRPCRIELADQRKSAATYGALPLLPVTGGLLFEVAAAGGGVAATGGLLARIISIVTLKTKAVLIGGAVAGSLAVGAVTVEVTGVSHPITGGDSSATQQSSNGGSVSGNVRAPLPPGAPGGGGDQADRPGTRGGFDDNSGPGGAGSDGDDGGNNGPTGTQVPGGGLPDLPGIVGTPGPGGLPPQSTLDDAVDGLTGTTEGVLNDAIGAVNDLIDSILGPLDLPAPIATLIPELPAVELPDLPLPELPLPEVPLPTIELPAVPLPTIELPPLLPSPQPTPPPGPTPEPDCILLILCN